VSGFHVGKDLSVAMERRKQTRRVMARQCAAAENSKAGAETFSRGTDEITRGFILGDLIAAFCQARRTIATHRAAGISQPPAGT
jgi:hypothetical protein